MDDLQREPTQWQASGRTMRWYEWLVILLLLALAGGVRATTVYKCTDAAGAIAYQDQACAGEQQTREIALDPVPPPQPSPRYAIDEALRSPGRPIVHSPRRAADEPVSYECRTADGQRFYRHSACPHSIAQNPYASGGSAQRGGRSAGGSVPVSSRRIGRDEACAQMHRAGRIGRSGHEHDEDVSTYERNLGRDPCR